ncbi:MAG: glycosyltransferase family 2 protein [Thermoanaerobaculales bacterium]|nr:glycosyltransferase family 2 protein [Thermoanaerobaculales bacterium]
MSTPRPELSVVVPAFNEEANVGPMHQRLVAALADLVDGLEVVFVDDGSSDATWSRVRELAAADPRVRGIRFARNFGHQAALTAGVDAAAGRAVVIIDGDLQDPPEVIPEMVSRWREGSEVVYGQREAREGETWFKLATAALFYRILRGITNVEIPVDTGDFRLMGPRAVAAFRALPERNRFIRGLVSWIGFPQTAVRYRRQARRDGATKFPLRKMLRFALDGITSFSFLPLRLATWAGFAVSVCAFLYIAVVIVLKAIGVSWSGYTSLMASILFLGGVQLLMIGILGEYLARIFDEVKRRPLYLVGDSTDGLSAVVPPSRSEP